MAKQVVQGSDCEMKLIIQRYRGIVFPGKEADVYKMRSAC